METVVSLLLSGVFVYAYVRNISFATFASWHLATRFMPLAFDPIKRVGQALNTLQQAEANAAAPRRNFSPVKPDIKDHAFNPKKHWPWCAAKLSSDHVTFAYGDASCCTMWWLKSPPGAVARSWSLAAVQAESTFAKLIPRFYDVGEVAA